MARVAIVTGGTRGIGEAISIALRDMGMEVAANYAGNDERAREFSDRTGIKSYKWDVSDYDACHEGAGEGGRALGCDRQRNCARIYRHRHGRGGSRRGAWKDRRPDPCRPAWARGGDRARRRFLG